MIRMRDVSKSFGAGPVLNGLNFNLHQGQVMGLLGRNGSGKTTLMRLALGLVRPDFGEVTTLGCSSNAITAEAKNRIGYVPQELVGFDGMTVTAALDFVAQYYSQWDRNYQKVLCDQYELVSNRRIGKLSGGQKQLVGIIMALTHKPDLLILDEPVSALDPINRRQFLAELIDLALEQNCTVLFSTHITQDIERVASHVCFLSEGEIALQGDLDTIKDQTFALPSHAPLPEGARLIKTTQKHHIIECATPPENALQMNLEDLFISLNSTGAVA